MRRVILAICATAVALVLLLSFKTHSQSAVGTSPAALDGPTPGTDSNPGTAQGTSAGGSTGSSTGPASSSQAASASAAGGTKTVTGAAWPTIYGPVQVRVTVKGGKVTAANAVVYPTDTPRDYQINTYAIPQLNSEAVTASSAKIDAVSGATYTSQGYLGSLQNALDKAGIS